MPTIQKFERSELDLYTFYRRFGDELSNVEKNNEAYIKFCKSRGQGGLAKVCSSSFPLNADAFLPDNWGGDGAEVPKLPTELHVDGREVSHTRTQLQIAVLRSELLTPDHCWPPPL